MIHRGISIVNSVLSNSHFRATGQIQLRPQAIRLLFSTILRFLGPCLRERLWLKTRMQTKCPDDRLGFLCLVVFHMVHSEGILLVPNQLFRGYSLHRDYNYRPAPPQRLRHQTELKKNLKSSLRAGSNEENGRTKLQKLYDQRRLARDRLVRAREPSGHGK